MKMLPKAVVAAVAAFIALPAHAASSITLPIVYTDEQRRVCNPIQITGHDHDSKKSGFYESVTATAEVRLAASEGRFLDVRDGAYAVSNTGTHVNRPGKLKATDRHMGSFATVVYVKSQAHRGKSGRIGRNAEVSTVATIYEMNLTLECADALGLFD